MISVVIHHRDLNYENNESYYNIKNEVFPVFIFTPEQTEKNDYFSPSSFHFLLRVLKGFEVMNYFFGEHGEMIKKILLELKKKYDKIELIENGDVSPYAKKRERITRAICEEMGVKFRLTYSQFLCKKGILTKSDGHAYKVFGPFLKNFKSNKIKKLKTNKNKLISLPFSMDFQSIEKLLQEKKLIQAPIKSGVKEEAKKKLSNYNFADYETSRDKLSLRTSEMSEYIKYNVLSPVEIFNHANCLYKEQLLWREFYFYCVDHYHVDYKKKADTLPDFNKLKWNRDSKTLKDWEKGETGIPIVDAAMRQLKQENYIHNRARMITATYLVHYKKIHWKEGEKIFAQNLRDYDYSSNLGGWQWVSGHETHSNPYFKIFSLGSQARRFDPKCEYVKRYVKELRNSSVEEIIKKNASLDHLRKKRINEIKKVVY